jgi:ATP-dependent DNA helicase RecQ
VELMLKQLAVDGVVDRVEGGWVATGKPWSHDAEHYDGIVAVRRREADIMRAYTRGERCLMQLLQESLDDPSAEPCGRCSVCRGGLPEALAGAPSPDTVATVTALLRGQVHVVEPRKMWPGGAFGTRGRIPADEAHAPGRALVYADAPEWRETVAAMFARDAAAPPEVKDACVRLLSGWRRDWPARPEVVVDLPAAGFPVLTEDVADHLAAVGRLDRARLPVGAGPGADAVREMGSAEEAAMWRDRLGAQQAPDGAVAGRSVLLVVDATSSLWPVTVASAVLRRAGAAVVLPLVLHRRP